MKNICTAAAILIVGGLVQAIAEEAPSADAIAKINTLLAEMSCEIDEDNIELEDGAYDLDDVICVDGQYDIKLDAEFNVTGKRKE